MQLFYSDWRFMNRIFIRYLGYNYLIVNGTGAVERHTHLLHRPSIKQDKAAG